MFHTRDTVELSYDRVTRSSSTLCGVPSAPTVSAATTNGQKMHHLALLVQCPTRLATRQPWQYCAWIVTPLPPPQNFAVAIVTHQSIIKAKESMETLCSLHPRHGTETSQPCRCRDGRRKDPDFCVFSTSTASKQDAARHRKNSQPCRCRDGRREDPNFCQLLRFLDIRSKEGRRVGIRTVVIQASQPL